MLMSEQLESARLQTDAANHRYVVALLGARMHYAVPRILHSADCLERLFTDSCANKGLSRSLTWIPRPWRPAGIRRLLARVPTGIPTGRITTFERLGWQYALRRARVSHGADLTAVYLWANHAFAERVCRSDWGAANAVFTYNSAGLEILRLARSRGQRTVMEQTIAPGMIEDRLLAEERRTFPNWENHDPDGLRDEWYRREQEEWELADTIVCGSDFVKKSIGACGGPVERCVTVPYGVDLPPATPRQERREGKLRVLMCGTVGLRKGVPYLVEAAKALKGCAEVRIVGPIALNAGARRQIEEHVELPGSAPRNQMAEHYQWADVFVLPSICEGSATVIYEALGHGLPVVTTPNAGSVVRDGVEGFVIPIRDVDAMINSLRQMSADRPLLLEMSHQARRRSLEFNLLRYQERLLQALS